eukprot:4937831-Amphidinium_carterae.1
MKKKTGCTTTPTSCRTTNVDNQSCDRVTLSDGHEDLVLPRLCLFSQSQVRDSLPLSATATRTISRWFRNPSDAKRSARPSSH